MKIVELLIDELEELGFDQVALVSEPAIEAGFFAFKENNVEDAIAFQLIMNAMEEKMVSRLPGEDKESYIGRCIPVLKGEGYEEDQAAAICYAGLKKKFASKVIGGRNAYDTLEEALEEGKKLGCDGHHTHELDGQTWYMACESHDMDVDVASLPDYNNETSGSIIEKDVFESYNDYPQSATNAAKRALEWRDSHPENDCGTRVGWARANQLANKENISEETIARMASFARHLQWEDVPYSEGCGGLMVDAWGGRAGIEWAKNKLESVREEMGLQDINTYDDLPDGTQDKLIERLSEIGLSRESLTTQGFEFEDEKEEFTNAAATAAIPVNRNSAKPDDWTNDRVGDFKILFQYKGPVDEKNRPFCRKLMDLDLLYRKEDIQRLTVSGANSAQFGYYNIFNYKGSFNCRHRWTKVRVYDKKGIGSLEVAGIIAAEKIFNPNITFSSQKETKHKFSVDGDLMRVTGAMMIPEKLIFRVDENEEPYYVYFSAATVEKIANKMMREKLLDRVNLEHDPDSPVGAHLIESWITKQDTIDKLGQKIPAGSWMATYQIEDEHIWELIKNGTFSGFSIEGFFDSRDVQ